MMIKKIDKYFWIANLVIVTSLILFFSHSLFTDCILAPPDFKTYPFFVSNNPVTDKTVLALYDPILFNIPMFHFDKQMLKAGQLPLWNPYQGCGVPHIANMQSAFFYPLNIFVYLFNWKWGFLFLYFFKLYFIGLFLYLYLKEIGTSNNVSILLAVSSMYMSFILLGLYFSFTNTAFFFPLTLWTIESILKDPNHFTGYLIFCMGLLLALFGGHPELVFYSMVVLIVYLFIRLYQLYKSNLYSIGLQILSKFFITFIIGVMISSIQLLPFLEYLHLSTAYLSRSFLGLHIYNLPFYLLLFNILPTITVGNMITLFHSTFERYQTIVIFGYTGVSVLLLGIAGMIALNKDKIVRTFILISIMALCIGFYVPYIHAVIAKIPGFNIGRNYYMLIFIGWALIIISSKTLDNFISGQIKLKSFKIASIAIFGLIIILSLFFIKDTFPKMPTQLRTAVDSTIFFYTVVSIIIIILTILILRIKNKQLLIILLAVLTYIQTALPMIFIEPVIKPEYFYPKNKILSMLHKEQNIPFRVTALKSSTQPIAYAANINTFYRLEDVRNYDSLGVNWYNSIFQYLQLSDALNLTNVRYLIVGKDFNLSLLSNNLQPLAEHNGYILYKNLSAFNRAFMVYHYIVAYGQQQALDLLSTYSGQLNRVAVVFQKDLQAMQFTTNTDGTYTIDFIKYSPGHIKLSCTTSQPGLFFISNTYFPGWHAYVDGKETKIIRTDYAFQGLWLREGSHTIELKYTPSSFKYGVLLSIIGIISLIIFYITVFRKKQGLFSSKKSTTISNY